MQSDFQPDAAVEAAARWIASRDQTGRAVIPETKTRFGISTAAAIEACRLATKLRRDADVQPS